jgi:mRNA-degrading endonuclease RelE of RelBE toxin-antitoxin system
MNLGTEPNNQQLKKNHIIFLDKAQIALDALQTEDREKVIRAINSLTKFPDFSSIQTERLKSIPHHFMLRTGIYRIIFKFQPGEVTILDLVNRNRLEILYNSLNQAKT